MLKPCTFTPINISIPKLTEILINLCSNYKLLGENSAKETHSKTYINCEGKRLRCCPENGKVVIKRQGRVIFIVEVIEVGFSISSPIGSDDWTEEDMELFEYINSLLMEHSILRALKRALRDGK
jgi:hypothetical protein